MTWAILACLAAAFIIARTLGDSVRHDDPVACGMCGAPYPREALQGGRCPICAARGASDDRPED